MIADDWYFWRIVASERYSVGLYEIENRWSLKDCEVAHMVLDMFGEM